MARPFHGNPTNSNVGTILQGINSVSANSQILPTLAGGNNNLPSNSTVNIVFI